MLRISRLASFFAFCFVDSTVAILAGRPADTLDTIPAHTTAIFDRLRLLCTTTPDASTASWPPTGTTGHFVDSGPIPPPPRRTLQPLHVTRNRIAKGRRQHSSTITMRQVRACFPTCSGGHSETSELSGKPTGPDPEIDVADCQLISSRNTSNWLQEKVALAIERRVVGLSLKLAAPPTDRQSGQAARLAATIRLARASTRGEIARRVLQGSDLSQHMGV